MVLRKISLIGVCVLAMLVALSASAATKKRHQTSRSTHAKSSSGKATSSKSKSASARGKRSKHGKATARGQAGPTPERVMEIQEALAKAGAYSGTPTGRFDAATSQAISRFQQSKGLDMTGKIGARTLKELQKYGLPPNSYSAERSTEPSASASP